MESQRVIIIRSVMPFQKQSRRHNNRSEADKKYGIPAPSLFPYSVSAYSVRCSPSLSATYHQQHWVER